MTETVSTERLETHAAELREVASWLLNSRFPGSEHIAVHAAGKISRAADALASRTQEPADWVEVGTFIAASEHGVGVRWGDLGPLGVGDKLYARAATPPAPERKEDAMAASLMRITAIVEGLYGFLDLGPNSPEELKENWTAWCNEKAKAWEAANSALTPSPIHKGEADYADYDAGLLNDFGGGDVGWWQDYLRAEIDKANDFWREQVASPVPLPVTDETERNILAWVREDVLPAYGITHNARASDPEMVEGLRAALSKPGEQG